MAEGQRNTTVVRLVDETIRHVILQAEERARDNRLQFTILCHVNINRAFRCGLVRQLDRVCTPLVVDRERLVTEGTPIVRLGQHIPPARMRIRDIQRDGSIGQAASTAHGNNGFIVGFQ